MNWQGIAHGLWHIRPWLIVLLASIYLIPILRLVTFPVQCGSRIFMRLNKKFGQWEEIISPARDTLVVAYLAGGFVWQIWSWITAGGWRHPAAALVAAILIALTFINRRWKLSANLRLLDFVENFPTIDPREFFNHLLCSEGAVRHRLPKSPFTTLDLSSLDFREGGAGPNASNAVLACGIWSTIKIARLALLLNRRFGRKILREVAPSLVSIWATRVIQLIRAKVTIEGIDNAPHSDAAQIYLYTHKSFLDFVIAPLVPISLNVRDGIKNRRQVPLFLMATDHFRRNILLYRFVGLGKVAEALGMIFVKRGDRGDLSRAISVSIEATKKILDEGMELAIFPQGTRALPYASLSQERLDAGYYTVGTKARIKADGKHLKKGAAFIATDTALGLIDRKTERNVRIIPIAIHGTAIACPKGSSKIASGVHMRLEIGPPIIIAPSSMEPIVGAGGDEFEEKRVEFASQLHRRIDQTLKSTARIHGELERRFFKDIHTTYEPLKFDEIAVAMKPWRGEDYLVHAILDIIYTCPPNRWRPFLGELVHLILNHENRDEILAFKGKVADALPI